MEPVPFRDLVLLVGAAEVSGAVYKAGTAQRVLKRATVEG